MGGGWVGYVYAIFLCLGFVVLMGGSTAAIYAYVKMRRRRGHTEPKVTVKSVTGANDDGA